MLDETFEPRPEIDALGDVEGWPRTGEVPASRIARVWFSPERARWAREDLTVAEELADGAVVVELPFAGTDWLVRARARRGRRRRRARARGRPRGGPRGRPARRRERCRGPLGFPPMSRRDQIRMSDAEVLAFLDEERTVICATNGPRGWPHLMPLWYVVRPTGDGGAPSCGRGRSPSPRRSANLERDPRATLQVEAGDAYEELRGVMLECDVGRSTATSSRASGVRRSSCSRATAASTTTCARWSTQQAPKRVGAAVRRALAARRGTTASSAAFTALMEPLKGLILSRRRAARACGRSPTRAPSSSCRSPTGRCCSTASRRWPRRASRRSGSSSRRRPATRSAPRRATARGSACG